MATPQQRAKQSSQKQKLNTFIFNNRHDLIPRTIVQDDPCMTIPLPPLTDQKTITTSKTNGNVVEFELDVDLPNRIVEMSLPKMREHTIYLRDIQPDANAVRRFEAMLRSQILMFLIGKLYASLSPTVRAQNEHFRALAHIEVFLGQRLLGLLSQIGSFSSERGRVNLVNEVELLHTWTAQLAYASREVDGPLFDTMLDEKQTHTDARIAFCDVMSPHSRDCHFLPTSLDPARVKKLAVDLSRSFTDHFLEAQQTTIATFLPNPNCYQAVIQELKSDQISVQVPVMSPLTTQQRELLKRILEQNQDVPTTDLFAYREWVELEGQLLPDGGEGPEMVENPEIVVLREDIARIRASDNFEGNFLLRSQAEFLEGQLAQMPDRVVDDYVADEMDRDNAVGDDPIFCRAHLMSIDITRPDAICAINCLEDDDLYRYLNGAWRLYHGKDKVPQFKASKTDQATLDANRLQQDGFRRVLGSLFMPKCLAHDLVEISIAVFQKHYEDSPISSMVRSVPNEVPSEHGSEAQLVNATENEALLQATFAVSISAASTADMFTFNPSSVRHFGYQVHQGQETREQLLSYLSQQYM